MKFSLALTAAALLLTELASAQSVSVLGLTKTRFYDQTGAGTLSSPIEYSMTAFIEGTGISGSFPSSSNRFQRSGGGTTFLTFDAGRGAWGSEDLYSTQSELDTAFPNASYSFLVGSSPAVTLTFPSTSYPNVPIVTASAGTWNGGRLLITPAEAAAGFTLTSNTSTGDGFLTLEVFSNTEDILYEEITINTGTPIVGTVPAGSLDAGQIYEVTAEFDEVVASPLLTGQSWAAPGARGFALFSSNTFFEIQALTATEAWRLQYFGSIANSGSSADGADSDGDGLVNLLELACGLNPGSSSTLPVNASLSGPNVEYTYTRSVAALNSGVTFTVEWNDVLTAIGWSSAGVTQQVLSDNGTVQQVKATLPAGSGGKRFVRLKVEAAP